ncbi:unnamed protein product [Effrenium voratum]|nr:unnamed protein product [Effrenium voratum]
MPTGWVLICVLGVINLLVSTAFAVDKWQATRGSWRIPRFHLLWALWLGPFLATLCMVVVHHKVRKRAFMGSSVLAGALQTGVLGFGSVRLAFSWSEVTALCGLCALWLAALGLQLRRGCACEPSTVHVRDVRGGSAV